MNYYSKCKICSATITTRGFKMHCVQKARFEVWQKAIGNKNATPHFDFYLKNSKPRNTSLRIRTWNI